MFCEDIEKAMKEKAMKINRARFRGKKKTLRRKWEKIKKDQQGVRVDKKRKKGGRA